MQASWIRRELIARQAHILTLLHTMPEPLSGARAVGQLADFYWDRLRELLEGPELVTSEDERAFAHQQRERNEHIAKLGTAEEEGMCIDALGQMQREHGSEFWATHPAERQAVDWQLDCIFLARIGLRVLLEHYVFSDAPRDGFAGIVEKRCSPVAVCRAAASEVGSHFDREHGAAPKIEVVGDASQTFPFLPSHIRFVVETLLRNSSVATLRHHHMQHAEAAGREPPPPLPPVRVIVATSDDAVQLKFEDQAGGIRRSSLINVWSYRSLDSAWWQPADGLSLPLVRMYCQYFGGSLALVPMEGWGTDCYVTFNRMADANREIISPTRATGYESAGLFDAQSRLIGRGAA